MKRIQLFALAAALMMAAACSEPLNEVAEEATPQNEAVATTTDGRTVADVNMERFAEILSKAVAQSRDLRVFFKNEAQKKIDNDYNVFYPISKRKAVGGETMEQMLAKYADESELAEKQATVPLLNVHLPELAGSTVADLDPDDEELPVLYNNVMYYDGEPIDTLAADEVPGFNILVVTESTSIRKRTGLSKSASDLALDDEYEYVDASCKPMEEPIKSMSKTYGLLENLSSKYTSHEINQYYIDDIVYAAAQNAGDNQNATRAFVYYGMNNLNQTPKNLRTDIRECIYRFRIAATDAQTFTDAASANGVMPIYKSDYVHKGGTVSKETALSKLLTGRNYGIRFVLETFSNGSCVGSEYIRFQIRPSELFNLYVSEEKTRHKTKFRHSKYTYKISCANFESKWYYPIDYKVLEPRFRSIKWDIANQEPYSRNITVYVENPCEGQTTEITITNSAKYVNTKKFSPSISIVKDAVKLNIAGELSGSKTIEKNYTTKHTILQKSLEVAKIQFSFFEDYPIERVKGAQCEIKHLKNSMVEMDVIPVSNKFYNNRLKK